MPLVVNTNIQALQAQNALTRSSESLATSFQRLATGLRINSSKDDASGLAISNKILTDVRAYSVLERNSNDGISLAQTADGALASITDILGRLNELATQGANPVGTAARNNMQTEFSQLQSEIKRIMSTTKFNGNLLVATAANSLAFQVGLTSVASDRITVTFGGIKLTAVLKAAITTTNKNTGGNAGSLNSLTQIQTALSNLATARANFGAVMNRFAITVTNIQSVRTNLAAAASRIRDVDVADETASLSKFQVLREAGASVLAQANQVPQLALKLLG